MRSDWFSEHLDWSEGRREFPYEDSVGKLTIGVGRNLDDRGLSQDEIDYLKGNDMEEAERLARTLPYFDGLNDARQVVVCDMVFNLGFRKWASFVKANEALADHDYETAADEMVDSKWYRQTKRRAVKNVRIMRRGVWE